MKANSLRYLIDENLPPALAEYFRAAGLDAVHINEFGAKKPVKDHGIRRYVMKYPNIVVVTRDDDFVRSYFSRKIPEKVVYVFDLAKKNEIMLAFEQHLVELAHLILDCELIELNPGGLKIHN